MPGSVAVGYPYPEHKLIGSSADLDVRVGGGFCFNIYMG